MNGYAGKLNSEKILGKEKKYLEIQYSKQAIKFLKKQDTIVQKRLIKAIHLLPKIGDVKRLQGREGYRLRVGDYRILFNYPMFEVLYIEKIDSRGQVYK